MVSREGLGPNPDAKKDGMFLHLVFPFLVLVLLVPVPVPFPVVVAGVVVVCTFHSNVS